MLGKVEICGVNTTKLPTLTAAETDALLHRAKNGDAAAREKLVEGNLRLVLSVIQRFSGRGENADDLFQVGCVGLLKAIDNFDTSQNVRFSTYGVPMIIGEIRRYLRDNSSIRVSRSMRDTAYRVLQAREKLQREQQREPTVEQIARELGIRREEVVFAMDAVCDPVSLFEPIYSDGGDAVCVMDQVRDNKNTDEDWLEQIALKEAMARLSERERQILPCATPTAKRRWRSRVRSASRRRRSRALRKTPSRASRRICRLRQKGAEMFPFLFPFLLLTLSAILIQYNMYFCAGGMLLRQIRIKWRFLPCITTSSSLAAAPAASSPLTS